MLTPQEVAKKSFAKARMGGYNMAMVDEFLDELTEDYTKIYEENAKLKAKLKVLVDKVEEYRSTEENMRAALFSAQKMATTIVEEAKAKSADIVTSAEAGAREEIARIRADVQKEEERLAFAKNEVAAFVAQWKEICEKQAQFLTQLPTLPVAKLEAKAAAAAAPAAPVKEEEQPAEELSEERSRRSPLRRPSRASCVRPLRQKQQRKHPLPRKQKRKKPLRRRSPLRRMWQVCLRPADSVWMSCSSAATTIRSKRKSGSVGAAFVF
ncbi:MAG: DivIVA domain-containing protein [Oscillospiraceae bacterium]|nr:DivIVA domain-containing protein [Oscillospiraceae bacterium]